MINPGRMPNRAAQSRDADTSRLQLKWSGLKTHERQLLLGLATGLALVLIWTLIWRPWSVITAHENSSENKHHLELQQFNAQARQAQQLLVKPHLSQAQSQAALNKITQSLLPQAQLSALSDTMTVTVSMAQASDLSNWISRIGPETQCQVVQASLNRAISNPSGVLWSARFVLKLPKTT
jgi:type II secretory pathway component PulM